jgi:Mitochondrial carrier protein
MSKNISKNRPEKLTVFNTLNFIYKENGLKGLYRGVTPRIGLGIWQTVCMVSFADYVKAWYGFSFVSLGMILTRLQDQEVSQGKIIHRTSWCLVSLEEPLLVFVSSFYCDCNAVVHLILFWSRAGPVDAGLDVLVTFPWTAPQLAFTMSSGAKTTALAAAVQPKKINPLLAAYLVRLMTKPLQTKMITSGA